MSAGPRTARRLALTFDDGPSTTTPRVLDALEQHAVPATFFVIGEWVERYPGTVQDAAARGHEIGNHTWTHVDADRERSLVVLRDEVARTNDAIQRVAGRAPTLLRPPYGSDPGRFARVAAQCALAATVLWSVQSFDWMDPDDPASIVAQVLAEVEPGAIVLLHDGQRETNDSRPRAATLAALPVLLERLISHGYGFASVSDLLAA